MVAPAREGRAMSRVRQAVFTLVCIAQLAVPASLIVKHERTRTSGTVWKFQTAPVDPADPFRGRYVQLAFAVAREPVPLANPDNPWLEHERRVYAELAAGPDGFARLVRVHEQRPMGIEYVDVFVAQMNVEAQREPGREHPPAGPPSV